MRDQFEPRRVLRIFGKMEMEKGEITYLFLGYTVDRRGLSQGSRHSSSSSASFLDGTRIKI